MYYVEKTYGHNEGLSCCFRQWRATSHCNKLHGYALKVKLLFGAERLDSRNWVVDFGDLKWVKEWLHGTFDHTLVVANDDPELAVFRLLAQAQVAQIVYLDAVGCEQFAKHIGEYVSDKLFTDNGAWLIGVTVAEHEGNSATWHNPKRGGRND